MSAPSKADPGHPIYGQDPATQAGLLSDALLREFMHRKKFLRSLKAFDEEHPRDANTLSSRAVMQDLLFMQKSSATLMEEVCAHRIGKAPRIAAAKAARAEMADIAARTAAAEAQLQKAAAELKAATAAAGEKERMLAEKRRALAEAMAALNTHGHAAAASDAADKKHKKEKKDKKRDKSKHDTSKRHGAAEEDEPEPAADVSLDDLLESNESHVKRALERTASMRDREHEEHRRAVEQEKLRQQLRSVADQAAQPTNSRGSSEDRGGAGGSDSRTSSSLGFYGDPLSGRNRRLSANAAGDSSSDEDGREALKTLPTAVAAAAAVKSNGGAAINNNNSSSSSSDDDDFQADLRRIRAEEEEQRRRARGVTLGDENTWKTTDSSRPTAVAVAQPSAAGPAPQQQQQQQQPQTPVQQMPPLPPKDSMIGLDRAASLLRLLCGAKRIPESFFQPIIFTKHKPRPYALVQREGGPCGAIAALQARLLVQWFFPQQGAFGTAGRSGIAALVLGVQSVFADIVAAGSGGGRDPLQPAVTVLLPPPPALDQAHFRQVGKQPAAFQARGVALCDTVFIDTRLATSTTKPDATLTEIVKEWTSSQFGLVCFILSCVLTRCTGTDNGGGRAAAAAKSDEDFILSHMDEPQPLIVEHGYCAQPLVNLMLCGWATSNVHDGLRRTGESSDSLVLKGLIPSTRLGPSALELGFLSMMEVRGLVHVGAFGKTPLHPVWVVYNESHYSVFFCKTRPTQQMLAGEPDGSDKREPTPFDVCYYDPLSDDEEYRLTVSPSRLPLPAKRAGVMVPFPDQILRTRAGWENARISWNGATPLL